MSRVITVLFADDNATIRAMIALVLGRRGFRVLVAQDGLEAVTLFQQHQSEIEVVALDVRMPKLEGPEALTQIRELRPSIPAILVSGFTDANPVMARLLERGVLFMPKPLRATELATKLKELSAGRA